MWLAFLGAEKRLAIGSIKSLALYVHSLFLSSLRIAALARFF